MKQSRKQTQNKIQKIEVDLKDKKHLVFGITGGIGAGKSTVLEIIRQTFDVCIIMADECGHDLMEQGREIYNALIDEYGPEILNAEKNIDKKHLAEIAFKDEESQARINAIEHPIIKEYIKKCIADTRKRTVFVEAALLKEGNLLELCDKVICVVADDEVRIQRLMENRGYSREKCLSIIEKQSTNEEFTAIADYTIVNNGDIKETFNQVISVLVKFDVCFTADVLVGLVKNVLPNVDLDHLRNTAERMINDRLIPEDTDKKSPIKKRSSINSSNKKSNVKENSDGKEDKK